ncbi:exported protein of unknown function [Modestobacter italicus]|uniref:Uncharacterized protein n=1 Tax=Modestobacter italicus (strain DSM 44449 / CECT 9708 / BC 501) TaxID=2732864 RepID=I4EYC5_MODI5|nr:exported protein of unknown function [Modestobacter marinus]
MAGPRDAPATSGAIPAVSRGSPVTAAALTRAPYRDGKASAKRVQAMIEPTAVAIAYVAGRLTGLTVDRAGERPG